MYFYEASSFFWHGTLSFMVLEFCKCQPLSRVDQLTGIFYLGIVL
jgi:hypothetical protein